MRKRIKEHPIMTAWFIILLFAGFSTSLFVTEYISTLEDPVLTLSRGDILFILFFFIMAKSSTETVENTLRNKTLKHIITSPTEIKDLEFSRFLKVFWYNLLLVAISMGIVTFLMYTFKFDLPIDFFFFPHLYILMIIAPLIGFILAIFSQLKKTSHKIACLFIYGQNITIIWRITHTDISHTSMLYYLMIIGALSILVLSVTPKLFLESWKNGVTTSTESAFRFHEAGDFLPHIIPKYMRRVAEKELFERWRRREIPASAGVVGLLSGGLIFMYYELGPNPDLGLGLGEFFYPALIGITIYVAIIIQDVIPSLSFFSREGKRLWAMKVLPIPSEDIVWGKVISMLVITPLIPIIIALPLPIILGYPIHFVIFAVTAAFGMIFSFSAIGVWAGAKFPNFDESVNGAPDVITMYTVLIMCLITAAFLIIYPVQILQVDYFLGVLAMIFATDMAALAMVIIVDRTSKIYDGLEMDI